MKKVKWTTITCWTTRKNITGIIIITTEDEWHPK